MNAPRHHAQRFAGLGKLRAFRASELRAAKQSPAPAAEVHRDSDRPIAAPARVPPAPFIGKGPCAPRYFPYLNHRTQAEIMAAEARG